MIMAQCSHCGHKWEKETVRELLTPDGIMCPKCLVYSGKIVARIHQHKQHRLGLAAR